MPGRVLIWGSGSAPCWRVMIALEEKGLQYESKQIEFSSSRLVQSPDQLYPQNCVVRVSYALRLMLDIARRSLKMPSFVLTLPLLPSYGGLTQQAKCRGTQDA